MSLVQATLYQDDLKHFLTFNFTFKALLGHLPGNVGTRAFKATPS